MTLQFLDDLTQPLALAPLGKQHRLERLGIVGKCVARRHGKSDHMSRRVCERSRRR